MMGNVRNVILVAENALDLIIKIALFAMMAFIIII